MTSLRVRGLAPPPPCLYVFSLAPFNGCTPYSVVAVLSSYQISKWAGLDHREEIIRRAIAKSSFKSMRRKEEAAGLRIFDEKYPDRDERWRMMRKGTPGGWEECFKTPASKDIWNELAFKTMYSLGYVTDEKW